MSEPEHCPGVGSENAGKTSACEGCPNKGSCSSGSLQGDPEIDFYDIARKLSSIKNIIIVMSGKGGVGKSTVSSQLARLVAKEYPDSNIGLLDIDICGPSIPKTMGIENEEVYTSASGWSPIYSEDNLAVMSCGFLLNSLDDAVIWRGPKKNGIIKQFLRDVDWGEIHYLFIDTPPGTSDEHISLVTYLKHCKNVRGSILVTTPQEIAQMDVRKQIDFCSRVKLPIIGIIENMSMFTCPKCKKDSYIFKRSSNSLEELNTKLSVPILGRIPLDPLVGRLCDEGKSLFADDNGDGDHDGNFKEKSDISSKTIDAFKNIWKNVEESIKE